MDYYPKPKIVSLDIDGILIESKFTQIDKEYLGWVSNNAPILKKAILEIMELAERILPIKYKLIDMQSEETFYLHQAIRNADYVIIITDRSTFGVNTVIKRLPKFEDIIQSLNHVQVRKSILNIERLNKEKTSESKVVKPNIEVFDYLQTFSKRKTIKPEEILVADDNPYVRMIAKNCGYQIFPNDIITTQFKLEKVSHSLM